MRFAQVNRWVLLCGAVAGEVTGSIALKAALERPALVVVVVAGYLSAFVLLAAVLRRGVPVGVAYGVWAACGVAATAVLAAILFGEPFTGLTAAGIALIAAGVLAVELGAQRAAREPHAEPGATS